MKTCALALGVTVFLGLNTSLAWAQQFNEGLLFDLTIQDNYKIYVDEFPTLVDDGVDFKLTFHDGSGQGQSDLFKNQNGNFYFADQNQLNDLTITSALDLYQNHPGEFAKYTPVPFNTNNSAAWNSEFTPPGEWAIFFVIPIDNGNGTFTYWLTSISYYEVGDFDQEQENWTVGPGWDGETPFVFTHVVRRFVEFDGGPNGGGTLRGSEIWGLDVLEATAPANESSLQILLPDTGPPGSFQVKQLFPLPVHNSKIDGPIGSGAVVEPNMSINGNWVIFSYFHDVKNFLTNSSTTPLPLKGADLYMINIAPLKADPSIDPATLTCHRLTSTLWDGQAGEQETDSTIAGSKNEKAMNPDLAENVFPFDSRYGRLYMHGIHTKLDGKNKLVFVSNLRRLGNSNNRMTDSNYNLNLYEAKINFSTGALTEVKQIHYYTTTSAMSPARMRDGFSFAYQSTTEEARSWEVQTTKSNYQWAPGVGYGINGQTALHLQTLSATTVKDWLVTCFYYNLNNNGFGTIVANPTADLGKNDEIYQGNDYTFGSSWGQLPRQRGLKNMIPAVNAADDPSSFGKFTAPRAGATNEIYASYSPLTSNDRLVDTDGNISRYDSYLVRFPDVNQRLNNGGSWAVTDLELVLDDGIRFKSQVWGVPVLSHNERFGEAPQSSPFVDAIGNVPYYQNNPSAIHGKPFSVIGTSALSNTDVLTKDERFAAKGITYDLDGINSNEVINVQNNVVGLSKVMNDNSGNPDIFAGVCHDDILGVAVHLTSNKPDASYSMDYKTAFGIQEITRLLGVYDVRGAPDDSFMATIPANQSIDLQLIDSEYGLKLADQRSWKSLKSGELRNDCGGCHNHVGTAVPFAGTHADGANYVPEDMVNWTKYIEYDAFCDPKTALALTSEPTLVMPEYYDDILPGLQANCMASCHETGGSGEANFNLDFPGQAYNDFKNKNYYNNDGALGSPLFWAARGKRTDNRDPALYTNSEWKYSSVHDGVGLCDGDSEQDAAFVYSLGVWLDHMMPSRTTQGPQPFGATFDRYHPSVNFDLELINNNPNQKNQNKLVVGYWDDSDFMPAGTLEIFVNGTSMHFQAVNNNGSVVIDVSTWNLVNRDIIEAVITDAEDNHQYYLKAYRDIKPSNIQVYPGDPQPVGGQVQTGG